MIGQPAQKEGAITYTSKPSLVQNDGYLLSTSTVMMGAATSTGLFRPKSNEQLSNSSTPICKVAVHYDNKQHISNVGSCTDYGTVTRGNKLLIQTSFDSTLHPAAKLSNGKNHVMGSMRVYIGPY
ncbi:hypothetical protein EJ08DRAFT_645635 [Tothia fuscella]|uniref:Uncharacterized protein n=1 Tax=Tothia fuscella TaxID=1048955 RepID=A0A9P4U3T5_9PEZI|nr:hypothetical protein EJ08DRAFT_645635 [Tothia fuscella]